MNFVAVRFSNRELPPFEGAALRFGIAALLFLGYALARGIPLPRGRALVGAIAFGLLAFGGAYAFGYWGLVTAPAAVGALAFALVPLITLVLAAGHGLERITPRALAGGALAAGGVGIVFRDPLGAPGGAGAPPALSSGAACAAGTRGLAEDFLPPPPAPALAAGHGLERITPRALAGGALAAVGVGIVFRDQLGAAVGAGALLALLAGAACAAESGVLVKYFPRSHPAATSATGMAAGTALLFAISLGAGERWGLPSQQPTPLPLLYLVASTVGLFATSLYVLGRWSASATAYQFVLFPLVTVVAAALLAGEGVGATFLVGAAIVMCCVAVAASRGTTTRRTAELPRLT